MRISLCQLNSRDDRGANLAEARRLLDIAAGQGADLAVLPELVDYLGPRKGEPEPETVDGEFAGFFASAAAELGIWVHAGSFREDAGDGRAYNTSLLFDRTGRRVAAYRKIHLYDVEIPGRVSYHESATIAPGEQLVTADVEGVSLGLTICYDLRFPELYRGLAVGGAQVLVVPAAFMAHTGRDHWEVLLRARAIENQCYVVAAGQIGDHDPGHGRPPRTCFGRSMVIDPWGTVLVQAPDLTTVVSADIDVDRLDAVRAELPSLANRRLPTRG
jgi:predicted amidohydrolase